MVTRPELHGPATTVAELRAFFRDDRVYMALVVDGDELLAAVERADLPADARDDAPARSLAELEGRTIHPHAPLPQTLEAMRRGGRRRLAVTDERGVLLGLLCMKASGEGFCSDANVGARHQEARRVR